jgi:hypothetical protein
MLNWLYCRKQRINVAHTKVRRIGNIDYAGRELEVTLGSSTETNLSHNQIKNARGKFDYFRITFSREFLHTVVESVRRGQFSTVVKTKIG